MDVILKLVAPGKGKVQGAISSAMKLFHENPFHKASNCIRQTYKTGTHTYIHTDVTQQSAPLLRSGKLNISVS